MNQRISDLTWSLFIHWCISRWWTKESVPGLDPCSFTCVLAGDEPGNQWLDLILVHSLVYYQVMNQGISDWTWSLFIHSCISRWWTRESAWTWSLFIRWCITVWWTRESVAELDPCLFTGVLPGDEPENQWPNLILVHSLVYYQVMNQRIIDWTWSLFIHWCITRWWTRESVTWLDPCSFTGVLPGDEPENQWLDLILVHSLVY